MPISSCRWLVACAASLALVACDDGAPATAPVPAGSQSKAPPPPPTPLAAEMVAAVSAPRNIAVISVHFALKGAPTVGKALPVEVAIVPHVPLSAVNVYFEAHDGMAVATGNVLERLTDPKPDKAISHELVLLPGREGVFMLTAAVETESSDGSITRMFSIPVIVSPASQPTAAAPASPAGAAAAPAAKPDGPS